MSEAWTALVTGASRGIGRAIVERFAADGARVAAAARTATELDRLAALHPDRVVPLALDVRDRAAVRRGVAEAEARLGRIDVLVNAAGVIARVPFAELAEERWQAVLDTNLGGTYRVSQAVIGGMMRRRDGRIINIASSNAIGSSPEHAAYDASKAGVVGLTRSLAVELAPHGIWVNAIAPGWTRTAMAMEVLGRPDAEERIRAGLPARRIAEPADVAEVALWLARETTRFLVGAVIVVDGGETIVL